ncbi:patatin-like phospholipase family protein [Verrucomicrobiota bacterium sgz303538]
MSRLSSSIHKYLLRLLVLVVTSTVVNATAHAAEAHRGRPKVGLVLSGGGALGAAHIGALKALEELHIPIDYISGTSMGAIVGGLYASGMSPEEIESWFRDADWFYLLSDSTPRESESFRTKRRRFDLNQSIGFTVSQKGLKLPAGVVYGRNLIANLRRLTIPVRDVHDFDRLPIPFRAVATDVENGEMVVLGKGDLVESLRATMAVPGVFTPQRIGDRLLIDGGSSSNLPIRVMQEMGADVIIAIDASEPLKKEAELDTAPAITNQVLGIFIQNQVREEVARLGPEDTYIRINVEGVGSVNFPQAAVAIDVGYKQTIQRRAELVRYSAGREQFQHYLTEQRIPRGDGVQVTYLKVQTPEGVTEYPLKKPIEFETKEQVQFAKIQTVIGDLREFQKYGVGDYEVIGQEGKYGLLVKTRERRGGSTYLNFGFDFAYSSTDETDFNLLFDLRMTELNALGAEWSTYLSVGDFTRVISEWYQPVDWERRFFIAPLALFGNDFIDGRDAEGNRIRFRQQDTWAGLDVGMRLWQVGEVRLGYARGVSKITRRSGLPEEIPGTNQRGWLHADLTLDTLDAPSFATRGYYGRLSLVASREELGADDNYTRLEGQFYKPLTFGRNTFVPRVAASLKLGASDIPLYDQSALGGFLNMSGLSRGSLFDQSTALAELVYYRKLAELAPATGRAIYGGFSIEAGEAWGNEHGFSLGNVIYAGSLFLGIDSVLGPLHLGIGVAEGGDTAVYLQLGPVFRQGRHQR